MVVVCPLLAAGQTTQVTWQKTAHGELMLRPFPTAPYPHSSRADGFKGRTQTYPTNPHYTDSTVGIFIPAGYSDGETVDYLVHFHGHNNHVSKAIDQYKLAEQIAAAKVNAILIVPQGPMDAADSGGGKLELDVGGFENLMADVTAFLNAQRKIHTAKIGRIILSTHSGGYKVTAAILDHGGLADRVTDVLLLDSSYGSLEWFAKWAAGNAAPGMPARRLVSLYTQHLAAANLELMGRLEKAGVKYNELDEVPLTDHELSRRGVTFMATTKAHDAVPVDYFGRLVKQSGIRP